MPYPKKKTHLGCLRLPGDMFSFFTANTPSSPKMIIPMQIDAYFSFFALFASSR
jgi:hypothetical protein